MNGQVKVQVKDQFELNAQAKVCVNVKDKCVASVQVKVNGQIKVQVHVEG